jgi:nucleotide-binding universal stress UspA family protein
MRILIGYDGSSCADAAIDDLARAGLSADAQGLVISVADVWPHLPASVFEPLEPKALDSLPPIVRRAHMLAAAAMKDARDAVSRGADRLRALFPKWKIETEAGSGSAAHVLVERARVWRADLLAVGACGHGLLGRTLLGSVSQHVIAHAPCSVRIGRARAGEARGGIRLILGLDGSPNSAAALHAITLRSWPPATEVRVVIAVDIRLATALPSLSPDFSFPVPINVEEQEWPRAVAQSAVRELQKAGLAANSAVRDGDPKAVLIEEADACQADTIVVGARGLSRVQGFLLGSVASTVASRARCSVEIVRFE